MSNQKPNSCYEFEHTPARRKKTMVIQPDGVCDACHACRDKEVAIDWAAREAAAARAVRALPQDGRQLRLPGAGQRRQGQLLRRAPAEIQIRHAPAYRHLGAAHVTRPGAGRTFRRGFTPGLTTTCARPAAKRTGFDAHCHRGAVSPVSALHFGPKAACAQNGRQFGIPLVFLRRKRGRVRQPHCRQRIGPARRALFATNDFDHIYLGGVSLRQLEEDFHIDKADLAAYLPCETSDVEKNHIQVHYMGYYERWHPQGAYYYAVEHGGFMPSPERTVGTYSKYNSIDDKIDDFFLLHHLHQIRHWALHLRRRAGDSQPRNYPRRGRGAVQKV